jgi:hypothetical protein
VDVRLGLESTGDPDLVRRIEKAINDARPAGVRVIHGLPTSTPSSGAQQAAADSAGIPRQTALADFKAVGQPVDAYDFTPHELASQPEGILNLRVEVLLSLAEGNLSVTQKEEVEDNVRDRVKAYIEALPMGAPLIFNKLLGIVVQPDTVADAKILIGLRTNGTFAGLQQNLLSSGRKVKIDNYDVFVGLMEETVSLEINVQVQLGSGVTLSPEKRAQLLETLKEGGVTYQAAETAFESILTKAPRVIRLSELSTVVAAELARLNPPLILVEGNRALVLNATYNETGRLLNNTEEVRLADYERPDLVRLTVQMPGGLDV